MDIDRAVGELAARQHSVFARTQARRLGLTRVQERSRLIRDFWRQPHSGVFAIAGAPSSWEQRVMAALLAAGPDAVASHVTAGAIWGFPNLDAHPLPVEITTTRPIRARLRRVQVHRTIAFLGREHTAKNGIAVSTPARTLVDMSAFWSVAQLGQATDYSMRKLFMRLDDLRTCAAGLPPAPGRKPSRIQAVLAKRLPGYDPGESGLEMRVLRAIVAHGLPEPVQQHPVMLAGRNGRIDLAYPEFGIAIEADSWEYHGSRSAFDSDRARENELVVEGFRVLRFTSAFTDRQIGEVVEAMLRSCGWRPSPALGREWS
jgi:hypothetical protein